MRLGNYIGIDVFVHWTFGLLVAYVAWASVQDGLWGVLFSVILLATMFLCVTLHEYGHALVARRFGIETIDITLLPIGGVARLTRIPRIPFQEFLVAVAGPAVNVVIVGVLLIALTFVPLLGLPAWGEIVSDPEVFYAVVSSMNTASPLGFVLSLVLINTALVLFNMIPAFPMDGGRVLRSVLAVAFEYRRATRIASVVGVGCAVCMALAAIYYNAFTAGLVAVFICYAGLAEARQVDLIEPIRHLTVGDVMIHRPPHLVADEPLAEFLTQLPFCPVPALPVTVGDHVIGILTLASISDATRSEAYSSYTAGMLADHEAPILTPQHRLEDVLTQLNRGRRQFAVADQTGVLVGLLDLDTLRSGVQLA
ncbi:MAG: site-2 protease family protein [Planctomycetota bacterium]